MAKYTAVSMGLMVACWLASGSAWAKPPFEPPGKGGIAEQYQAFPATGQMTCWDSSGINTACDDTGHDGDIQAGAPLAYTDNGDGTITDENTSLMWMKQDDNNENNCELDDFPDNLDKDCKFTWDEAFEFVDELNMEAFAGYTDWRVPNVKELQSIVNYEKDTPAASDEFNNGCAAGCTVDDCSCTEALYWSSTSNAVGPPSVWLVDFDDGSIDFINKNVSIQVRAVRGGL